MKITCATFLICSVLGIAVFGVFGMNHESEHGMDQGNCIAATVKGTDCPKQADPIDSANFHLDAFRSFSTATFGADILTSLLILTFALIGVGLGSLLSSIAPPQLNFAYSRYGPEQFSPTPRQQLLRWLALHENSPASL